MIRSATLTTSERTEDSSEPPGTCRPEQILLIYSVVDTLEHHGSDDIPVAQTDELRQLSESLKTFSDLIEKTEANRKLKEICR